MNDIDLPKVVIVIRHPDLVLTSILADGILLTGCVQASSGQAGPDRVDFLDAIDKWASGGPAPEELTANFAAGGGRKVCAYPKVQTYKGSGDGKSPDQFECK